MTLRSYGPGKFDTLLDEHVYLGSLDGGCDDETGDAQTTGWYGLINGELYREDLTEAPLNEEEHAFLSDKVGAILHEDSQGFVSVDYFTTAEALNTTWIALVAEVNEGGRRRP